MFTDRRCEDLGALARQPAATPRDDDAGLYRRGCPRRLSELVNELRSAIGAGDVNRLSSVYLWSGLSGPSASQVLTRLEAIAARPLVDIAPVYPDIAAAPATASGSVPSPPPRPRGLRLEQTLGNGGTPARTVFDLRRQYNCFWVSF